MSIAWRYLRESDALPLLLQIAWLWWLAVLLWIVFIPERKSRAATVLAGVLTLVPAWLSIAVLVLLDPKWVLYLLLLVISVDVGAYLCGRRYGRIKLAPLVSPGKTWEGVLGGVLSSLLVMGLAAYWFDQFTMSFFIVGLLTVAVSIVGDLSESLFKRQAGLKDSGNILPGHGGILDRIDSITAAAPVFVYGLMYLGVSWHEYKS
jgi:phosphatidate cytidylyltransferase